MKIIDIIRKIFKIKTLEEEFKEFVFSDTIGNMVYSGFDKIIQEEVDRQVKFTIKNNLIGIDEKTIVQNINRRIFDNIDTKITEYESINKKKSYKYRSMLTIEYVDENVTSVLLANNSDYIVNAFQRFIDANLERVKKEDEEREKELEYQYEDLDFAPLDDIKKASEYDDPNFEVYTKDGYVPPEIIPPIDEESDVVSEDDESIEILGEVPDYDERTDVE